MKFPGFRFIGSMAAMVAATLWITGCAGGAVPAVDGSAKRSGSSSVEVFGVIDAGVSHTTTRSERR